jgi:hypothetical protein
LSFDNCVVQKLVPGPSFGLAQNMADFTNMAELTG